MKYHAKTEQGIVGYLLVLAIFFVITAPALT